MRQLELALMYGPSFLQKLIPQRLTEAERRLEKALWQPVEVAVNMSMTEPQCEHLGFEQARELSLHAAPAFPFTWGRKFDQAWFRLEFPDGYPPVGTYLYWNDEGEATLYADGLPWYGFDAGHHRAPLPDQPADLWVEGVCVRTGVWVRDGRKLSDDGSCHRGMTFWKRDEQAWEVYWDYKILIDLLKLEYERCLPEKDWNRGSGFRQEIFRISPLFRRVMRGLDRFVDAYDHGEPAAGKLLKALYAGLPASSASLKAVLTGHAHIDLVWLWPERVGDAKAVHTFATANRLLEMYPEFRFAYSQPASYDAVARRSPKLMNAVREKISKGIWEATGGADVESDTQLPCGEALARSFLVGQERFQDLRGETSRVLWLPDVFGYSPCVPQILQQSGIPWFFTTKLAWGNVHRFPYSSFRWQGHDGSEVLCHVSQEVGYNGDINLAELTKMEECQQEAGIHNEFLVPTGYGDGGGGVNPEVLERARRVRDLCGLPRGEWDRIEDFFARLEPLRPQLPLWQGELYLEYHRGVQTTHGDYKAAFRAAERSLQVLEAAHALSGAGAVDQNLWRRVILCQFHDAIPGSSIREVYEEQIPELRELVDDAQREAVLKLGGTGEASALFNPIALARTVVHGDKLLDLLPLSITPLASARLPAAPVEATLESLRNGCLEATFNACGEVASLTVDGRALSLSAPGNQIWLYPDHPHAFEAWDIDRGTVGNGRRVTSTATASIEQAHPAEGVLAFRRPLTEKSSLTLRYRLKAESPVLEIEWELDWRDPETLVKALFPTAYNGRMARFGAPFGSALRPQQPGDPRTEAMFEVPGSRWAQVCDEGEREGLSLITEAKYGFSARQGTLSLSLLRSAKVTDADLHPQIRDLENTCPFSDIGPALVRAAVTLAAPGLERERQPAALADRLYTAPLPCATGAAPPWLTGLRFEEGSSLIPVWVRPMEDGSCVVRLNETLGRRGQCRIHLPEGTRASLEDLSGRSMGELGKDRSLAFTPYGLYGLRIFRT